MTDVKSDKTNPTAAGWSRRDVLKATSVGAVGAATPMFFTQNAWAEKAIGNYPVNGSEVVLGFNVPQTGAYADEGADELRAYKLAVTHLNNGGGMLDTLKPSMLKGNGILGKKVTYVTGDTQTNADASRTSARRMIERDKVIMVTGGSSSGIAIAQQYLCNELGIIFMCGLTHSNDTTGKDKQRYGFRHFFNAHMTGKALSPVLSNEYGKDRRAFHLTADYSWGHTQQESMQEFTEKEGWGTEGNIMTPLKTTDFSQYLSQVLNSDADVLILNHYGANMVNSLTNAVNFGMRDMQKNGKNLEIVVPLYSRLMAKGAGSTNIDGVLGTSGWNWALEDEGSKVFVKTFSDEYGFPPSQAAHTCYVQTLLYANACEMAGTFYPPEVIKALEDFEFTGAGNGPTLYRGSDHQCIKDILVMQGKSPSARNSDFDYLQIVDQVDAKTVDYDPAIFGGELGPYEPA